MNASTLGTRITNASLALLAVLVLHLALIQPNHPDAVSWRTPLLFPLELPAILFALIAFGQSRAGFVFRLCLVAALTLVAALKGGDFAMRVSLDRRFNLVADLPLIGSFIALVSGAFGAIAAILAMIAILASAIGVAAALWWASGFVAGLSTRRFARRLAGVCAMLAAVVAALEVGEAIRKRSTPTDFPGAAFTTRVGVEHFTRMRDTLADLRAFRVASRDDPYARRTALLDRVDRDVFVIFIESYGRTSFDTPLYADLHVRTLEAAQADLEEAGLDIASTFLTSPTQGGQSWLAHASVANGLWIDNQPRYRAALNSGRRTLFHLAAKSGFHTAAVMPQITLAWPESRSMGFDTILAAADLGYTGEAFNWVTMPDQFAYAAMDRVLGDMRQAGTRLFVQVATGSSHAPWVPVPELVDWAQLGDGTIFNPLVASSAPPRVIWLDDDRVREQYRLAVDYALQAVFAYARLHADDPPLMLVIGDHQAAGFVALDERPHVPMHVIGPAHLVDLLADEQFTAGLIPDPGTQTRPMSDLRAHVLDALTSAD